MEKSERYLQIKKEDFPAILEFALNQMEEEKNVVISGFRGSGLYPFNPSAVDYDILNKRKKNKKDADQNCSQSNKADARNNVLEIIEKKLPADLLCEFKKALINDLWTGDIQQQGLYDFWLQVSQESSDNSFNNNSNQRTERI